MGVVAGEVNWLALCGQVIPVWDRLLSFGRLLEPEGLGEFPGPMRLAPKCSFAVAFTLRLREGQQLRRTWYHTAFHQTGLERRRMQWDNGKGTKLWRYWLS